MVYIRKSYILTTEILIHKPRKELFLFFGDAGNLQRLTPPWLDFKILSSLPITMKQGTIIVYQLRLGRIPITWQTEIRVWDPPFRFIDRQLKGPYLSWIHEHRMEENGRNTLMTDHVEYQIPGLVLGATLHALVIKHQLKKIFTYRQQVIQNIFNQNNR